MKAFMDRVNATLPTEEPDYILLSLVQAARDKVCGAACPAGQGLADGGRCVPNAILAGEEGPAGRTRRSPAGRARPGDHGLVGRADAYGRNTFGCFGRRTHGAWPARRLSRGHPAPLRNAPVQSPAAATAPGAPRSADAKRAAAQPSLFGLAIFKQFEKLGF